MKTIYLVRHGETVADIEDRLSGDYETQLTNTGLEQAETLAKNLRNTNIEMIFTSPQWRALQTASAIEKVLPVPKTILPGLRARNRYGIMTGLTKQEAENQYPAFYVALKDRYRAEIPLAEPYPEFSERLQQTWEYILLVSPLTSAIVTHGAFFKWFTAEIMKQLEYENLDRDGYFKLSVEGGGVVNVEIIGTYVTKS